MPSVADALRREHRQTLSDLPAAARIELALRLGDADLRALCDARGLSPAEARAIFAAHRRLGRRPSRCHDA